jgi:hypothetical protein
MAAICLPLCINESVALTFKTTSEGAENGKASKKGALTKSDVITRYEVKIDEKLVANLKRPPTYFDFSKVKITSASNLKCFFDISRQEIETNNSEDLGSGILEMLDGRIHFLKNSWRTGGISSPLFLQTEANLVLNKSGQLVGRMPYFHLFINKGEVALPPEYVTLGENKKESGEKNSPEGLHVFFVDDWQRGRIRVRNCVDIS